MTDPPQDSVECYSGHEYAQRPKAIRYEGQRYLVEAVQAEWRTPEGKTFQVETLAGGCFEISYYQASRKLHIKPL